MFCEFDPPLLNSANVWATTKDDLKALYWSNFTGGITTRTTLIDGFSHDDKIHQHCFFDPNSSDVLHESVDTQSSKSSLNTLGYSPLPLTEYIEIVCEIENEFTRSTKGRKFKPVIFSVTGTASQICECYAELCHARMNGTGPWLMEINLSCPNIVDKPPPAYSQQALSLHLKLLQDIQSIDDPKSIPVGIKVPPYTYQGQFDNLINALLETTVKGKNCPITFISATNTLGNCLVMDQATGNPALASANGSGIGGLAGSALHPLALGNVRTIRRMLDLHESLKHIKIIGIGGVSDAAGYKRMLDAGAAVVEVGTALGLKGVGVFEEILSPKQWIGHN